MGGVTSRLVGPTNLVALRLKWAELLPLFGVSGVVVRVDFKVALVGFGQIEAFFPNRSTSASLSATRPETLVFARLLPGPRRGDRWPESASEPFGMPVIIHRLAQCCD